MRSMINLIKGRVKKWHIHRQTGGLEGGNSNDRPSDRSREFQKVVGENSAIIGVVIRIDQHVTSSVCLNRIT